MLLLSCTGGPKGKGCRQRAKKRVKGVKRLFGGMFSKPTSEAALEFRVFKITRRMHCKYSFEEILLAFSQLPYKWLCNDKTK